MATAPTEDDVLDLIGEVERLEAENERLRTENERLKARRHPRPPKLPRNRSPEEILADVIHDATGAAPGITQAAARQALDALRLGGWTVAGFTPAGDLDEYWT